MYPLKRRFSWSFSEQNLLKLFYIMKYVFCSSPQPLSPEKTVASFSAGLTEAERMRQLRNQEARELIGSRVGAAKAIFTSNTSEGQLQNK